MRAITPRRASAPPLARHGGENAVRGVATCGGRGYIVGTAHELYDDVEDWGAAAILHNPLATPLVAWHAWALGDRGWHVDVWWWLGVATACRNRTGQPLLDFCRLGTRRGGELAECWGQVYGIQQVESQIRRIRRIRAGLGGQLEVEMRSDEGARGCGERQRAWPRWPSSRLLGGRGLRPGGRAG